jgi:thiol-disulfide isomerase/thioredoxin
VPEIPRFGRRTLLVSTALAAIAAAMVLVLFGGSGGGDDTARSTVPTIKIDPERPIDPNTVTMVGFDGTEVAFAQAVKGTPTVVNFFASTCVPCITEMPDLEEVHQQLGDRVQFLGLAVQDRIQASQDLIERTGVTYRTARDPNADILSLFNGTALPLTVLLDADGAVKAVHPGQLTADELRTLIADDLGISV